MDAEFEFNMSEKVTLLSGETGEIIGRAEYAETTVHHYLIRYTAGDGRLVESWWSALAIRRN